MTIDEAIAHARKVADRKKKAFQNCEYDCRFCLASKPCNESAEEHEQLAEWLELLKWYQQGMEDIPSESGVLPKDVYRAGYNKAIDDFMKECEAEYDNDGCPNVADYLDYKISIRDLCKIAEQLKEGGEISGSQRTDT